MDEYKVGYSKGLDRYSGRWTGCALLELNRNTQTSIEIQITKPDAFNPEAIITAAQNYHTDTVKFNGRTWYVSRSSDNIGSRHRPINVITFSADLIEHIETVGISFNNVPDASINEFMSSLVITGYGTK